MTGSNRGNGKGIQFLRSLIGSKITDCIPWPYNRDPQGRGTLGYNGDIYQAHRLMCELVNGPPPTPKHHAAHSCGQGHNACVNPNHVGWKTPAENQKDMVEHGTTKKPGSSSKKLTEAQVVAIRSMKGIKTHRELAAEYGVAWETIGDVQRGRTYTGKKPNFGRMTTLAERKVFATRAFELRAAGKTYYEIAAELGVSRPTVKNYIEGRVSTGL